MALAAVIFIIIMYQSSQEFSFDSGIHGLTTTEIVGYILLIAGVVGVIIAVAQPASHGEGKLTKLFGGS